MEQRTYKGDQRWVVGSAGELAGRTLTAKTADYFPLIDQTLVTFEPYVPGFPR